MSEPDLAGALRKLGVDWPAPIHAHESIDSTNRALKELARDGAPEWTVVTARRQTAGRGRLGRHWSSPPGHAYVSVLFRPRAPPATLTTLSFAVGVAGARALAGFGVAARLKWPNDIWVGERKIAGLLAEVASAGEPAVVVGVGVNVAPLGETPAHDYPAVGMGDLVPAVSPVSVIAALLGHLREDYRRWSDDPSDTLDDWRELSLPWWGMPVRIDAGGDACTGIAEGIDDDGALVVKRSDGRTVRFVAGDVRRLRREAS